MIGRHAIALCNRRRGPAFLAMAFIALAAPKFGHASEPDPAGVLGLWMTEKNTAAIEIYPCEENLCGKIVWLARPYKRDGKNSGSTNTTEMRNWFSRSITRECCFPVATTKSGLRLTSRSMLTDVQSKPPTFWHCLASGG